MVEPARGVRYVDYLLAERASEQKHEYVDGAVYAMAGGSIEHGRLAANLAALLIQRLRDKRCVVLNSDVRIRIEATNRTTYPDLSVVCGAIERSELDDQAVMNPVVIVEVLSDSTERSDGGEKFAHYRRIDSLREYVLVSQDEPRVEVFRREGEAWTLREAMAGSEFALSSLTIVLDVDELYRNPLSL